MPSDLLRTTLTNMGSIVPETILSLTIMLVIVYDMFLRRERSHRSGWLALVGVGIAFIAVCRQWGHHQVGNPGTLAFGGTLANDSFGLFFKLLIYSATMVVLLMSLSSQELVRMRSGEYYALLLTATLASSFLVSATNLLMLYLAFETLSLPSYVLAGYRKGERQASEASLKYVLFGAVASGVLIYGLSLLYGLAGSLQLDALTHISRENYPAFILTLALIVAGFGFKMSAVPFHFWAPDVYEGAPTPITAYLAAVSKAAAFAAFLRLIAPYFDVTSIQPFAREAAGLLAKSFDLQSVFWIVAVLTMTIGNFVALRQKEMKRLLAYSSIAHAGYLLTAFVAANQSGFSAVLFYFFVYFIAVLGLFVAVAIIHNRIKTTRIAEYRGLFFQSPLLAVAVAILLWSLIGLPPSAGFIGKWKLFYAVIQRGEHSHQPYFYYSLVLIALVNSVVSLYYYIAIVKTMCFYEPEARQAGFRLSPIEKGVMLAFALPILLIQLNWEPITWMTTRGMNVNYRSIEAEATKAKPITVTSTKHETIAIAAGSSQ